MDLEFLPSIGSIPATEWDALNDSDYPFLKHAFLYQLEQCGCTTVDTGWEPMHLVAHIDGELVAAIPLFIKSHSYGEYVFDWSWANAYAEHGYAYYPKLINAIPFTPCTGPRWLIKASLRNNAHLMQDIEQALLDKAQTEEFSGIHCLFTDSSQPTGNGNWLQRFDCQYHWFNQHYSDFDDFLQSCTSRKRKNIKKEREKITRQNIRITIKYGKDITATDWIYFHSLYQLTYLKRSGHGGYLNSDFFVQIGQSMPDNIIMVCAFDGDEWVAAALYFFNHSTLFGRYWGCKNEYDALHFECCYYQGIDFAIEQKLERFDSGAQGQHKIARGFQPVLTQSFHRIHQPMFASAIDNFLAQEKQHVKMQILELRQQLPFKEDHRLLSLDVLLVTDP